MNPNHQLQQRPWHLLGLCSLRSFVTSLFILLSGLYVIYSSSKVLITNERPDCPVRLDLDASENIESLLPLSNLTATTTPAKGENNNNEGDDNEEETNKSSSNNNNNTVSLDPPELDHDDTEVKHIVFGIAASSNLWDTRKQYIKLWWRPQETRGIVWLDKQVRTWKNEGLPETRISGDTSRFPYTNARGKRSALRISRVVSETFRLGMEDVRWFVMGDDDTVFLVDNVVRILNKYDHRQFYYVGSSSESHVQNIYFSYSMAYGGGGFAISYPLAKELEKMQDNCMERYSGLYGSDDRIQACMAELGVPLSREPGFHQYDVYGNLLGLLGAHPVTPLASLHHLDVVEPIFPRVTRIKALQRLFESINLDSASVMQQSICYDKRRNWSISLSWGYVVQIQRGVVSPRELETPTRTFLNWYKRADYTAYAFNTRPVTKHPCQKPFIFYFSSVHYDQSNKKTIGVYSRHRDRYPPCRWKMESPEKIDSIIVHKTPDVLRWQKSPRRDCCRVLNFHRSSMYVGVGNCHEGEISEL